MCLIKSPTAEVGLPSVNSNLRSQKFWCLNIRRFGYTCSSQQGHLQCEEQAMPGFQEFAVGGGGRRVGRHAAATLLPEAASERPKGTLRERRSLTSEASWVAQ